MKRKKHVKKTKNKNNHELVNNQILDIKNRIEGKKLCNEKTKICFGEIVKVGNCSLDNKNKCYFVDMGKDYSRLSEHPIYSNYHVYNGKEVWYEVR